MKAAAHRRGQALVPVLFVVLILTAFAVTLSARARRETREAHRYLGDIQAYYIARGAVMYAAADLQQSTNGGTTPPTMRTPPDTDANGWTQLGDGWYKVEVVDTASRVNINTASAQSLASLPAFGGDPTIPLAIVDWRDADDTPGTLSGSLGAESEYYEALSPPYDAKNSPFDSIAEILLVRGMTTSLLYDPNAGQSGFSQAPGVSRAAGRQAAQPTGEPIATDASGTPLAEMLTTYSRERNVASDGTARVNVKTASADDLQETLGISPNLARRLVESRGSNGSSLNSIADLLNIPGFTRQVMQSIGDRVTVTDSAFREGRLNINTASSEALATIPGVDQAIYDQVIQARESGTTFTGLNDLFQLTSLNRQQLQALVDNVCTKSSIYLVRVKVRMPNSRAIYAVQAMVELTPPAVQAQGSGASGPQGGAQEATASQSPRVLQWQGVGRDPGWQTWAPAPDYGPTATGGTLGTG
ncbi:MAG: general secretion pathway protein GspK [Chthonomonadales bacterium]|nr:general secretion pathway protein GspK [Chthonomonadales bacterium]